MKNRKRIAVIMSEVSYQSYQHRVLDGLLTQAHRLDYDVVIFASFLHFEDDSVYQHGENKIFDLICFDTFDAVIYIPCAVNSDAIRAVIEERLKECTKPIVALEYDKPQFINIPVDDRKAFECMTDHMIDKHGYTDMICLTGFKDNLQAEQRLAGFMDSMKNHGLEVTEENYIYGDFWIFAAEALAIEIAEGKRRRPQAIICCCDNNAVALVNKLMELGINVPGDIAVSGYDQSDNYSDNVLTITSYVRPLKELGINGVLKVHELLTGEKAEPVDIDHGYIVTADSCGCGKDIKLRFKEHQEKHKSHNDYSRLLEYCPMSESINSCTSLNACLQKLSEFMYLINNFRHFYLCLNEGWDDYSEYCDDQTHYTEYTDKMHLRFSCAYDPDELETEVPDIAFDRSIILPALYEDRDEPLAFFISPLHFNERNFGFSAITFCDVNHCYDSVYNAWTRNLNNALEFMRVRNIFESMNQLLFSSSVRDTLTGVYNRKGFDHFSSEIFAQAVESGKKLLVMVGDLDRLKYINDTFGHIDGDNAITVTAQALSTCCRNQEICARTGGDEFVLLGCGDYSDSITDEYSAYIAGYLDRYNKSSGKPYEMSVSVGFVLRQVTGEDDLDALVNEADELMYKSKVARRMNRTT